MTLPVQFNRLVDEVLNETPDFIRVNKQGHHYTSPNAIGFIVKGNQIVILPPGKSHHAFFYDLIDRKTSRELKETAPEQLIKDIKSSLFQRKYLAFNLDYKTIAKILHEQGNPSELKQIYYQEEDAITGRVFNIAEQSYITFWGLRSKVLKNLDNVLSVLKKLNVDPKEAKWEIGLHRFTSYDNYVNIKHKQSAEDIAKLKAAQQAHLQAGMKRAITSNKPPMRQINPSMTNVQYRDLTTFGDSYKALQSKVFE
jgi:hypothetical protein